MSDLLICDVCDVETTVETSSSNCEGCGTPWPVSVLTSSAMVTSQAPTPDEPKVAGFNELVLEYGIAGHHVEERLPVLELLQNAYTIGRFDPQNPDHKLSLDLSGHKSGISRQHGKIAVETDQIIYIDLSSNGTVVIIGGQPHRIRQDQVKLPESGSLILGDFEVRFSLV